MRLKAKCMLAILAAILSATPALAQKKPGTSHFGTIFTPQVYAVEPGIEAALNLTDEQRAKLVEAMTATIRSPELIELGKKIKKGDPDREANQAKYQENLTQAEAEFQKRVEATLTAEQKATVAKVNEAIKTAIAGVLTPEQKEAVAKTRKPGK